MEQNLNQAISTLREESRSLWLPKTVKSYYEKDYDSNQSPVKEGLQFLRDHVATSVPCVWRGRCKDWKAVKQWRQNGFEYLHDKVGQNSIEVTVTPDGRADAVLNVDGHPNDKVFVRPEVVKTNVSTLLDKCVSKQLLNSGIPYYSAQNSCLTQDVPQLQQDLGELPFLGHVFDKHDCSAVNIWIGDDRSVSTLHSDPFENIYAVITGCKSFLLRPPCDAAILPKPELPNAKWTYANGVWSIKKDEGTTAWIDEDHSSISMHDSVVVDVYAGDILYLPALWCMLNSLLFLC